MRVRACSQVPEAAEYCSLLCRWRRSCPRVGFPPSREMREARRDELANTRLTKRLRPGAAVCLVCGGLVETDDDAQEDDVDAESENAEY